MVRTLSKDISEKDREINRLNGLLEFYKKTKETKKHNIDNIIEDVKNKEESKITLSEVNEPVNEETGEVNPNFVYDIQESEPSPDSSIHSSDNLNETIEPQEETKEESKAEESKAEESKPEESKPEESKPEKTLLKVKKNNKTYFVYKEDEPEQIIYEYNEEKRTDKIVGKRTRVNGKWSWKLN